MAYALEFNGTGYLNAGSPHNALATTSYRLEIVAAFPGTPSTAYIVQGNNGNDRVRIRIDSFNFFEIRYTTSSSRVRWSIDPGLWFDGFPHTFKIIRSGSTHELFIDDVSQGTSSSLTTASDTANFIGRANNSTTDPYTLYSYTAYDADVGGNLIFDYKGKDASGTEMVNSVGTNAVQQDTWPADDSEWEYYDDGSGGGATFSLTMPESVTPISSEFIAVNQSQHFETSESETSLSAQTQDVSQTQSVALTATETPLTAKMLEIASSDTLQILSSETPLTAEPLSVYQHVSTEAVVSETPLSSATIKVGQTQVVVTIESETPLTAETLSVSQVHELEGLVTETLLEAGTINVSQSVHLFLIESETPLTSNLMEVTEPGQLIVVVTETPHTAQALEASVSQHVSQVESETPMSAEVFQISQSVALISIDSETAHMVQPVSVSQSQHLDMLLTETALQSQLFEISTVINVNSLFSETPLTSELIEIILKNIDTDPDALKPISATLWFRLVNTTETFKLTMR